MAESINEKARAYYYGEILRGRRIELKMTQKELAEKIGTARSYIARIEKGETADSLLASDCDLNGHSCRIALKK